jgi:hypothetical protein
VRRRRKRNYVKIYVLFHAVDLFSLSYLLRITGGIYPLAALPYVHQIEAGTFAVAETTVVAVA